MIYSLRDGTVIVDEGPAQVSIFVLKENSPSLVLARKGANKVVSLLRELVNFKTLITQNIARVREIKNEYPRVVTRMILSAKSMRDQTVTPLICVAGTIADEVADSIFCDKDVSKVIVNNGGDIAIRLRGEEIAKVGIRIDVSETQISHILTLDAKSRIGGVATSGFGGRSFSKGIASAAVAISATASIADSAATLCANATNVNDPLIERKLAENIYPGTDIPGQWITTKVGNIDQTQITTALDNGLKKAIVFQAEGLIFGALIAVKGQVGMTETMSSLIHSI
jgi:ApbE superfamily uncharacterized protein (UPF0280 family)